MSSMEFVASARTAGAGLPQGSGQVATAAEALATGCTRTRTGTTAPRHPEAKRARVDRSEPASPPAAEGASDHCEGSTGSCRDAVAGASGCCWDRKFAPLGTLCYNDIPDMLVGHLNCQMCAGVLQQPVSVQGRCQHVFCYQCVLQSAAHANLHGSSTFACPSCKKEAPAPKTEESLMAMLEPNYLASGMLKELKIHCRFGLVQNAKGMWEPARGAHLCSHVMKQEDIAAHEEICPYAAVVCPIPGCEEVLQRQDLDAHVHSNMQAHMEKMLTQNLALQQELHSRNSKLEETIEALRETEEELKNAQSNAARLESQLEQETRKVGSSNLGRTSSGRMTDLDALLEVCRAQSGDLEDASELAMCRPTSAVLRPVAAKSRLGAGGQGSPRGTTKISGSRLGKLAGRGPAHVNRVSDDGVTEEVIAGSSHRKAPSPTSSVASGETSIVPPGSLQGTPKSKSQTRTKVDSWGTSHEEEERKFHWRKYGEKKIVETSSTRSYFRCTFPGCGVRKRVEAGLEDVYSGQHNHAPPPPRGSGKGGRPKRKQQCTEEVSA